MVVAFNVSVSFQQVFVHKKITACKLCRSYWQHVNKCHNQQWLQLDLLDQDNQRVQNEWTEASEPSKTTLTAKPILKCTSATQCCCAVGSGPRYQILSHVFARCASQKTHWHTRIAREKHTDIRESHAKRVQFSHVRVFSDSRNVQKKCDTNHIPWATAYCAALATQHFIEQRWQQHSHNSIHVVSALHFFISPNYYASEPQQSV